MAASARAGAWLPTLLPGCALLLSGLLLVGCAGTGDGPGTSAESGTATQGARGYKVGKPYQVKGVWYYPKVDYDYAEVGVASWYGPGFDGQPTANGEIYDMNDLTAAHRTLPLPSIVRVTNLENGRSIKLRANDRGPFVGGRIIDVSRRAAQLLGFHGAGTARVQVDIVEDESRQLAAALGATGEALALRSSSPVEQAAVEAPALATAAYEPAPTQVATAEIDDAAIAGGSPYPTYEPAGGVFAEPTAVGYGDQPGSADPTTAYDPPVFAASLDDPVPARAVGGVPVAQPPHKASSAGHVYVQAAAFAEADRADRARRRLAAIGPTVMSPGRINGRDLLRVRVGPLGADDDVDRVLASVSRAGFPDCRLVVE